MRWMLVPMVLLIGVAACSTSGSTKQTAPPSEAAPAGDAGPADGHGDDTRCPFPVPVNTPPAALSCPSDCPGISGEQVDDSKRCIRGVLVGCLLCPNGCGGAPEGPCYRNVSDGRIVRVASYAVEEHPGEWVRCTAAEDQQFAALPRCND